MGKFFNKTAGRIIDPRTFWAGAGAGGIATIATYPADVITTMKQTGKDPKKELEEYKTPQAKLKRLYSGVGLKLVKNVPQTAIVLGTNALLIKALAKKKIPI